MFEPIDALSCPTTRELVTPLPVDPDDTVNLIGHTLSERYTVIEPIGKGAFGRVYRAEQVTLHRNVAIKVLNPVLAVLPAFTARFCREAFAASRVHHPNAVSIIDVGRDGSDLLYIVMEYVPGVTLRELIRRTSRLPLPRVIDIMAQVLMGMDAIHEAGIIHADLKTANIMVEPRRAGEIVKVVDFGIARLRDPAKDTWPSSTICAMREQAEADDGALDHITGTPGYIAPEVIRGGAPTCQCDVYAAGVVMYQLLTGQSPFPGADTQDVLFRQLIGRFRLPSALREDVPPALDQVVATAMAKRPCDRFASMAEFRRALQDAALQIAPGALPYRLCNECACPSGPDKRCGGVGCRALAPM